MSQKAQVLQDQLTFYHPNITHSSLFLFYFIKVIKNNRDGKESFKGTSPHYTSCQNLILLPLLISNPILALKTPHPFLTIFHKPRLPSFLPKSTTYLALLQTFPLYPFSKANPSPKQISNTIFLVRLY